jgi:hypothetical protein
MIRTCFMVALEANPPVRFDDAAIPRMYAAPNCFPTNGHSPGVSSESNAAHVMSGLSSHSELSTGSQQSAERGTHRIGTTVGCSPSPG